MIPVARRQGAPLVRHVRLRLRPGLSLLLPMRTTAASVPADAWLQVGTRRWNLDRLPRDLARLLPPRYAHATAEQWAPLVAALEGS
jgi:hypothetical protein